MSEPDLQVMWRGAVLLSQQGRSDMAMAELRRLLTVKPDFAPAHALLAQLLAMTGEHQEALREAQRGIAADPELPFAHYAMAQVHFAHDDHEPAAAAILQAIELDPHDADFHGELAHIRHAQKRHAEALAAADAGLAVEPKNTDCLNLRSLALVRLGRKQEAQDTLDASLAHDPDNPYTHQARGFALLNQGDAKGALHHFQQALRREPTLDAARAGLVQALKSRNPLYRWVLGWFLWLDRFSSGKQRQILIGIWAVVFFGSNLLQSQGLDDWSFRLSMVWLGLVLLTACAVPFFNLLLLLHPIGRRALPRQEMLDALLLGMALLLAVVVTGLDLADVGAWTKLGFWFCLVYLMPVSGMGAVGDGWPRRVMQSLSAALLVAFVWWAVRFEMVIHDVVPEAVRRGAEVSKAEVAEMERKVAPHRDWIWDIAWVAVLSTWFVLFAPKKRRRR